MILFFVYFYQKFKWKKILFIKFFQIVFHKLIIIRWDIYIIIILENEMRAWDNRFYDCTNIIENIIINQ